MFWKPLQVAKGISHAFTSSRSYYRYRPFLRRHSVCPNGCTSDSAPDAVNAPPAKSAAPAAAVGGGDGKVCSKTANPTNTGFATNTAKEKPL